MRWRGPARTATEAATEAWESGAKSLLEEFKPALKLFRSLTDEDGQLTDMGRTGVKLTMQKIADILGEKPEAVEDSLGFWQKTVAQFKTGFSDMSLSTFTHGGDPASDLRPVCNCERCGGKRQSRWTARLGVVAEPLLAGRRDVADRDRFRAPHLRAD